MIGLAVRSVRHRLAGFAGAFLTAVLTVALLSASGLLMCSALTGGTGPDRFAAADLTVAQERAVTLTTAARKGDKVKRKSKSKPLTGAAVLPPALVERIAAVDGVARAVPDVAFPVDLTARGSLVRGPHGTPVVGHGWASAAVTPYRLRAGAPPGPGEVVLDGSLGGRVGERVTIVTRTGTYPLRVSGVTTGGLADQGAVFLAAAAVTAVSGLAGPTAVAVFARPGVPAGTLAARLRGVVGDAGVYAGGDKVRADLPAALPSYVAAVSVFGIVLAVTAFAAVFVLVGCVGLVVAGRLRELALLRTVGATPRQLRRLLGAETAAVTLLAGLLGAAAGGPLARLVAGRFRGAGVVPAGFTVGTNPLVLAGAVLAGTLLSLVAARVAAGRATRIAPTEALRETAAPPPGRAGWRIAVTVLGVAGAAAVLTFVPLRGNMGLGMCFVSCALLLCAAAAAGPLLVRLLATALTPLASATGVTGWLAAATVRVSSRRTAAVAMPLMLLVGLSATLLQASTLTGQVAAHQQAQRGAGASQLTARGTGVPLPLARQLAAAPGVRGLAATVPTTVMIDEGGKPEHYAAQGLLTTGATSLHLAVRQGRLDAAAGTVAASADLTAARGWHVGDRVVVWLPDATRVVLRLDAVYRLNAGFGDLVLPADLVAAHDPAGLVRTVYVTGRPPASPALLAAAGTRPANGADTQQAAFGTLLAILVAFIGISVVNTFAIATTARRREFTDLRLAGATVRQVRRTVGRETVLSVVVGVLLGGAIAASVYGPFSIALDGRWHWVGAPAGYAVLVAGTALLGLAAGAVPASLVVRRRALPAATT